MTEPFGFHLKTRADEELGQSPDRIRSLTRVGECVRIATQSEWHSAVLEGV